MPNGTRILSILVLAILVASACGKSDSPPSSSPPAPPPPQAAAPPTTPPAPFRVVSISMLNNAGEKTPPVFAPSDTIFAVIKTEGSTPKVELKARWTYEDGQVVNESARTIELTGPSTTEFHIAKPSGWPTGKYKFELTANGDVAGTKDFSVN
jgi:hypothetical protein